MDNLKGNTEVIDVPLTGKLQTIYNYIENHIRHFLIRLQETGCVSSSYTINNLTGDYTRFILKQEEKRKSGLFNTNQTYNEEKYKMLICLHTLVSTAELVKECGIMVARGTLFYYFIDKS